KAGMPHIRPDAVDWVPIDSEVLKRVYDDLVMEAGVQVLFHTVLSAVETENGAVRTLLVTNKRGLTAYRAHVYVDATGDADLVAFAGAAFEVGGKDHEVQPASHCFTMSNVDMYQYPLDPVLHAENKQSPVYEMARSEKYPLIRDTHLCNSIIGAGTVGFNAGHLWNVDSTDPFSVSAAMMEGRKIAASFEAALHEYAPAFRNAHLVNTAPLMGIRESRRIVGDYTLTLEDYLSRRTFSDEICRNSYYIDIHATLDQVSAKNAGTFDQDKADMRYQKGESHGIPYRCLTPHDLQNVLVAGRSISCDHAIQASVRVMPVCLAMGEAAGIAASMAAKAAGNVHTVDVPSLRNTLRGYGAYID
ncbi:MAG: FAD-dependent oxidoreductase, partial [Clostridia bacterium]